MSPGRTRANLPKHLAHLGPVLAAAQRARKHAHAPYSRYRVGAALLTKGGGIYAGCNVENASFGATLCAERSAIAAMVANGDRHPVSCVLVTGGPDPAPPCGICRQVLVEFAKDLRLLLLAEDDTGEIVGRSSARLSALFPQAFRLEVEATHNAPARSR